RELVGRDADLVVDLATLGADLLDWQAPSVASLVEEVAAADVLVVASPTFKATYSGLLKLFLDRFAADQLQGVAVPLMLGGSPAHSLAPEFHLRPLLTHLGARVPAPALYVLESQHDDPGAYTAWLASARPVIGTLVAA